MNVKLLASCKLPIKINKKTIEILSFNCGKGDGEVIALIHKNKNFLTSEVPIVRIHSACITGEVFGSQKCDCACQFEYGMKQICSSSYGIMLYMAFHEGRGIGLTNKIKAYKIQEEGVDTLKANELLGFQHDERGFESAVNVLKFLKIKELELITNNPQKIFILEKNGIKIKKNINTVPKLNIYNKDYIETKKYYLNHIF